LLGYHFSPLPLPLATLSTRRSRYKISAAPEGGGIAHLEEFIPSMSLYTSPAKLTISRESNFSKQSHNPTCALTERARVRADESAIGVYSSHIEDCLFDLEHHPDSECTRVQLEWTREHLFLCTNPSSDYNSATTKEWQELERLSERRCSSSPWICGLSKGKIRPNVHEEAIVGGYVAFLLT
jgi:hypothetical protein